MPLHRRLPKRGFNNYDFRDKVGVVNVGELDDLFEAGATIDEAALRARRPASTAAATRSRCSAIGEVTKAFTSGGGQCQRFRPREDREGRRHGHSSQRLIPSRMISDFRWGSACALPRRVYNPRVTFLIHSAMISAFANTWKIPELRDRILFTLALIVIIRLGVHITLPGVDATVIKAWLDDLQKQDPNSPTGGVTALAHRVLRRRPPTGGHLRARASCPTSPRRSWCS